jgi:hypothetical protein
LGCRAKPRADPLPPDRSSCRQALGAVEDQPAAHAAAGADRAVAPQASSRRPGRDFTGAQRRRHTSSSVYRCRPSGAVGVRGADRAVPTGVGGSS